MRTVLAGEFQSREPIGRDGGLVSGVANDAQRQLQIVWFVLDHEDLGHPCLAPVRLGGRRAGDPA